MKIQYGCGLSAPKGWVNFDSSPTLRLQQLPLLGELFKCKQFSNFPSSILYGDIIKGLKVEDASVDWVYCSHVLEHSALEDFRKALVNTYLMLKRGGIFRFVLPDLEYYIQVYQDSNSADRCSNFMADTMLGRKTRKKGVESIIRSWLGGSAHYWMWDYRGIAKELADAGFEKIRRVRLGDSGISAFDDVEDPSRWGTNLGVQCRRPEP